MLRVLCLAALLLRTAQHTHVGEYSDELLAPLQNYTTSPRWLIVDLASGRLSNVRQALVEAAVVAKASRRGLLFPACTECAESLAEVFDLPAFSRLFGIPLLLDTFGDLSHICPPGSPNTLASAYVWSHTPISSNTAEAGRHPMLWRGVYWMGAESRSLEDAPSPAYPSPDPLSVPLASSSPLYSWFVSPLTAEQVYPRYVQDRAFMRKIVHDPALSAMPCIALHTAFQAVDIGALGPDGDTWARAAVRALHLAPRLDRHLQAHMAAQGWEGSVASSNASATAAVSSTGTPHPCTGVEVALGVHLRVTDLAGWAAAAGEQCASNATRTLTGINGAFWWALKRHHKACYAALAEEAGGAAAASDAPASCGPPPWRPTNEAQPPVPDLCLWHDAVAAPASWVPPPGLSLRVVFAADALDSPCAAAVTSALATASVPARVLLQEFPDVPPAYCAKAALIHEALAAGSGDAFVGNQLSTFTAAVQRLRVVRYGADPWSVFYT